MTKEEMHAVLNYLKATAMDFYIVPAQAVNSWHKSLGKYNRKETIAAIDHIVANLESGQKINYLAAIKNRCERVRYNLRSVNQVHISDAQERKANASFAGVPGRDRGEQIKWLKADQAATHWRAGEEDNGVYNQILLEARDIGFLFDGVDYDRVIVPKGEFDGMRVSF